jgi:ribosome-associated heat shock protein Hsp15
VVNHPRIDKWLWSARFFKTRGAATAACVAGKVKMAGRAVKPASPVAIGDEIRITRKSHKQTVRVTSMQARRVSAKLASEMYADITPTAELENLQAYNTAESAFRQSRRKDSGKPTKQERRAIQKLKGMT